MSDINLSCQTTSVIDKYISKEETAKLQNKISTLDNKSVTVTNTGVVSSGKSSLFNALLGIKDGDAKRFKIGAARTTMSKDIEKYSDDIELVDTPGIDVKEEDDEVALNAICASSVIVMVHNIKMGMLQQNEVDWLKKIVLNFNGDKEQLKNRFIFVNTWIDERMMEKSYQSTVEETKRILFDTIGTEVEVYNVSAKLYTQGISKNQQKFIDISNILALKEAIIRKAKFYADNYGVSAVKKDIIHISDNDTALLTKVRNEKNSEKDNLSKEESDKYIVILNQWKTDYNRFKDLAERYNDVVRKLNNL